MQVLKLARRNTVNSSLFDFPLLVPLSPVWFLSFLYILREPVIPPEHLTLP